MKYITGGVTAPLGFTASGIHCGIRKNKDKKDLALIYCDTLCTASAVYTQNLVKGAPNVVTKNHLENGVAQAIICNSGNANTCNADGEYKAQEVCNMVAKLLNISADNVIVGSTGVIGQVIPLEPFENGMEQLVGELSTTGSTSAAEAIMTTDTFAKEIAVETTIGSKTVKIGGIAKGSGMIHPNMATMLGFLTTDCAISKDMIKLALTKAIEVSFNMISVDGDTSTNDMVALMASGTAGNEEITSEGKDFDDFCFALTEICKTISKKLAGDGEGATKLLICNVTGANSFEDAKKVAKSVICSSLLKAAMFAADANWGRVLCAIGYSGANIDINSVDVSFVTSAGSVTVCKNGSGVEFSEVEAKKVLSEKEITINVIVGNGSHTAEAYGCDLTYDYVKINADYRS